MFWFIKLFVNIYRDLNLLSFSKCMVTFVGSSGLRIIKKGGVELIIPKPLLIKIYSTKAFTMLLSE